MWSQSKPLCVWICYKACRPTNWFWVYQIGWKEMSLRASSILGQNRSLTSTCIAAPAWQGFCDHVVTKVLYLLHWRRSNPVDNVKTLLLSCLFFNYYYYYFYYSPSGNTTFNVWRCHWQTCNTTRSQSGFVSESVTRHAAGVQIGFACIKTGWRNVEHALAAVLLCKCWIDTLTNQAVVDNACTYRRACCAVQVQSRLERCGGYVWNQLLEQGTSFQMIPLHTVRRERELVHYVQKTKKQ